MARIVGTSGRDVLRGTSHRDVIIGKGGNDKIIGRGGNDKLKGGSGKDVIKGGDGKDTLGGGSGNDKLKGGDGKDVVFGGKGADDLFGGPQADTFRFKSGDGFHDQFPYDQIPPTNFDDIVHDFVQGIDLFDVPDPDRLDNGLSVSGDRAIWYNVNNTATDADGSFLVLGNFDPDPTDFI